MNNHKLQLILDDGSVFYGNSFGALPNAKVNCEVVFQTGMVGYVETLSDPSYQNQILVFTYPMIGNYGVPPFTLDDNKIPIHFESDKAQPSAIIVNEYVNDCSHWNKEKTLASWLQECGCVGMCGVDTRSLTELLRENGTMRGIISLYPNESFVDATMTLNDTYKPSNDDIKIYGKEDSEIKVLAIDCGMKNNQIRLMLNHARSVRLDIAPWNVDLLRYYESRRFDRLFISNGPGNPESYITLIENLQIFMQCFPDVPIFGICLGHQILALASGAKTFKLKYGNRGINIPCRLVGTEICIITSQNHGYAVNEDTLQDGWKSLFQNLNDGSNEGIYHETKPYFSVQFHPEAKPGPMDSEKLFDVFLNYDYSSGSGSGSGSTLFDSICRGLRPSFVNASTQLKQKFKKVLILGSGGLCIGQSGEFDYSGSQAIKAYKEEGLTTILVNPNIATVQTSPEFVDKVYFLPVTPEFVEKIIDLERPDCIALSFGGQSGLNTGSALYESGVLSKYNVAVLGTSVESINKTEDRNIFKQHIYSLNEHIPDGAIAETTEDAIICAEKIGYPVLVRAAFALGGLGSGFANNRVELLELLQLAFSNSHQVIIDKSLRGWKEIEYEIVRDKHGNCLSVCNMENIDPLGVHTGESIVVAPSQTLTDDEYYMLRNVAFKIVNSLNIVGECNIQYALDPHSKQYYIIEMNARLSRSSALASKATGYPLAYIAAKLSLGYSLSELKNSITKTTSACFEPSLDYCVVKMPRWDLEKFELVTTKIDSSMKSVGEGMGIGRTFEEAIQKALRMTGLNSFGFHPGVVKCDKEILMFPTYKRILAVASGLYSNCFGDDTISKINEFSNIDMWFLNKFKNIVDHYHKIQELKLAQTVDLIYRAKRLGFSDRQIAYCSDSTELAIRELRLKYNVRPMVKKIDTVAGEFPCSTNYLYSTYSNRYEDISLTPQLTVDKLCCGETIMVLGSGVYKIGSSVEFDWCAVSCIRELRKLGKNVIVVNCNPETVSTDYDEADKLYFEELSFETVMDIYQTEKVDGVIVSVGGQIPNNIAMDLHHQHVNIIGTSPEMIDRAENRHHFSRMLDKIGVNQPLWRQLTSIEDAKQFCAEVQYPCLVRPSYVLSGAAMNVAYSDEDLETYLADAVAVNKDHPVVISKFINDAKEIEVDAVAHNGIIKLIAISEHVENAGVHSGDATLILPAQDLTQKTLDMITESTRAIAEQLCINGPFNVQFIAKDDEVKVIECNVRVSRSLPFVSKTTSINFVEIATRIMCNEPYETNQLNPKENIVGVKVAQFSFNRLKGADILLDVEMKSTGEVACFGENKYEAYLKALTASGFKLPQDCSGNVLLSIGSYRFKNELLATVRTLSDLGFVLYCTHNTSEFLRENNIKNTELRLFSKNDNDENTIMKYAARKKFVLIINVSERNKMRSLDDQNSDGYKLRRTAVECNIPIITDIKSAKLFVSGINWLKSTTNNLKLTVKPEIDCFTKYKVVRIPGLIDVHVHVREPGDEYKEDWDSCSKAAIAGGITTIFAMPNTKPNIVDDASLKLVESIASQKSHCDYGLFVGANNDNVDSVSSLSHRAIGLKMYLNNTTGSNSLIMNDSLVWMEHLKKWPKNVPVCVHAESLTLAAILHAAFICDRHVHVCHVSNRQEITLIRESKKRGMNITCEVAPHHLFLTSGDFEKSCLSTVKPPLSFSEDDVDALWENIAFIDCFATDHAPHTLSDKEDECKHCFGFPGLETALVLLLTAVHEGRLTIEDIILRYHTNPMKIFNIHKQHDTYVDIDLNKAYQIPVAPKYSKCGWTPFAGKKVFGEIKRVVIRGKTVFVDGMFVDGIASGLNVKSISHSPLLPDKVERNNVNEKVDNLAHNKNNQNNQNKFENVNISDSFKQELTIQHLCSKWKKMQIIHILSADQFDTKSLKIIFEMADIMKNIWERKQKSDILAGRMMAAIFYEPSTRTRCSFTAAMQKLGGEVIDISSDVSSVQKGETLEDFVRCMQCYADVIVLRTNVLDSAKKSAEVMDKHLINAGDGCGEHPTQAILDMYTIREEIGTVGGNICVTLFGDLKYGRTVHSLVKLLALRPSIRLRFVSPASLKMPKHITHMLETRGIEFSEHTSLDDVIENADVLYVTRIQKERLSEEEKALSFDSYQITPHILSKAKKTLRVMHPLPRVNEISAEIDSDPRAAYFRQMQYGLYVRMALLTLLLK